MQKTKQYPETWFAPEVIRNAVGLIEVADRPLRQQDEVKRTSNQYAPPQMRRTRLAVELGSESWEHDSEEEFFADYRRGTRKATYDLSLGDRGLHIWKYYRNVTITVNAPSRAEIEAIFDVFEQALPTSKRKPLPAPPEAVEQSPRVFIGHGGSTQWRDLKDHLRDKHEIDVVAYEIGARTGMGIRDILSEMLTNSSFAVLVMTGEDQTAEGSLRARQNVVHETGLFQGKLGFAKAIVLLEEGTEVFSNLQGTDQLRYPPGQIAMTFGDVVWAIVPFQR